MGRITMTIPTPGVSYGNVRIEAENVHEFKALHAEFTAQYPEYDGASTVGVDVEAPDKPLTVDEIAAELGGTVMKPEPDVSDAKAAFLKKKKED